MPLVFAPEVFGGVIRPWGPGKPELLRLINRLVEPTEEHVGIGDQDVTALHGHDLPHWRHGPPSFDHHPALPTRYCIHPRLSWITRIVVCAILFTLIFWSSDFSMISIGPDHLRSQIGAGRPGRISPCVWGGVWSIICLVILMIYIIDWLSGPVHTQLMDIRKAARFNPGNPAGQSAPFHLWRKARVDQARFRPPARLHPRSYRTCRLSRHRVMLARKSNVSEV